MTYYLYTITNKNNGNIYIGRTKYDDQIDNHKYLLQTHQHFNRLLQKDYNNQHELEYKIVETSDDPLYIANKAIDTILRQDLTNPIKGYNSFFDSRSEHRSAKLDIYDEDLAMCFILKGKSKALKEFGMVSNVFDYRIQRQGLGFKEDCIPISTYESLYHFCAVEAMLSPEPISASGLLDRCMNTYSISGRLRPTPHKISKNLKGMKIPFIVKGGLSYFTPNDN